MKRFLFHFLLLTVVFANAQTAPQVIKVSGSATHIDSSPLFKAMVSVGSNYSSLPSDIVTLENMKTQYRKALEAQGIAWSSLKENPNDFGYETMGYENNGTIYEYVTDSSESMKKFLGIKTTGVQRLISVSLITIDSQEATELIKSALANAKLRAEVIAKEMGRELGPILEVEDLNGRWGDIVESSLYYDRPSTEYKYAISVVFKVK